MFENKFLDVCLKHLEQKSDAAKEWLVSGAAQNIEDYRFASGKIVAYRECVDLLRECFALAFETKPIISRRDEDGVDAGRY